MDVLCYEDLDEFGRDLDDPIAELEQDIVHMLLESYGSNAAAPYRSIGLEDALSAPSDPQLANRIESKLMDDPRIDAARVTITLVSANVGQIQIDIQANETELGITLQFDGAGNLVRVNP